MYFEDLEKEAAQWSRETGQLVLAGVYQDKLLRKARLKKFDAHHLRVIATRKLPRQGGGTPTMLTLVFRDSAARRSFIEWSGLKRWYYYSQPPPTRDGTLPIRAYIDLDASDSKSRAGFLELETYARDELWPALCDFCSVPQSKRRCIVSTNHKVADGVFQGSVHIQSAGFAFLSIWHYARCFRAFLRSCHGTPLMKRSWELYGFDTSKNAQGHGVIDAAPIGREDGSGYHKFNETNRVYERGLDVWDYDILSVSPAFHMVRKLRKASPHIDVTKSHRAQRVSSTSSVEEDSTWFKAPKFACTAISRMAAKIREHTGSNLADIKLVRLPSKTKIPDGAEYRLQFPSRRGFTNKCILAGVEHSSNNIKMLVRLHDRSGPRLWVGCHSRNRKECGGWQTVYEEHMSPLQPPDEPTDTIPKDVLGKGTHVELAVWTRLPFRLRIPGYTDITNLTPCTPFEELKPLPRLANTHGVYMSPQIAKQLASGAVADLCFELQRSAVPPAKKRRTNQAGITVASMYK